MSANNKISLTQAQRESLWPINVKFLYLVATAIILLIIFPIFNPQAFHIHLMIMIFLYATMSQSWNVLAGFSGQISLGHVIFFGIGGYTSSFLFIQYGISPWFGMLFGVIFSVIVAVIIGIPILRLSGHYFAIATLLIGFSFQTIFQRWDFVGAASGIWIPLKWENAWFNLQFHDSKVPYYYIFLIFFISTYLFTWILYRSKIGFKLRAVRDDPQAALSLGISVSKYKIIAFAISAGMMSPMGTLFSQYILVIDPDRMFNFEISIIILLIVVMGGIGNIWGPLLGTSLLIPLSEYSRIYFGGTGGSIDLIVYGLLIMLICIFKPSGLISLIPNKIMRQNKVQ